MKEDRNQLTSIIGGLALRVIFLEKPSIYIPFKGDFPMVKNFDQKRVIELLQTTRLVKDLPEDVQKKVMRASQMTIMEKEFREDLHNAGVSEENWRELDNADKANLLVDWMERNNLSMETLKVN